MSRPRVIERFDPGAPLGEVLRDVIRFRFDDVMEQWEAARKLEAADDEALHDLRVALRRLRTVLRTFRAEAAGRRWRAAERALRRVFRATGPLRDTEVLERRLERLAEGAPDRAREGIEAAEARCRRLRRRARPAVRDALTLRSRALLERRVNELVEGRLVTDEVAGAPFGGSAPRRLVEVLDAAAELASRVVEAGRTSDLHELRIGLKRVRYIAEVFEQGEPGPLAAAIARLGTLQDALGEVHDLDVQMAEMVRVLRRSEGRWLRGLGRRARASEDPGELLAAALDGPGPPARQGILWLLDRMALERAAARATALQEVDGALAGARVALDRALAPFGGLSGTATARRGPRRARTPRRPVRMVG